MKLIKISEAKSNNDRNWKVGDIGLDGDSHFEIVSDKSPTLDDYEEKLQGKTCK